MENTLSIDDSGLKLLQKMTSSNSPIQLREQHAWGCLACVLEGKMKTSSKGLLKWEPRTRIGACLSHPLVYSGNVALTLNLSSRHVSPELNAVFDNDLFLVSALRPNTALPNWANLVPMSAESTSNGNVGSSKA